MNPMVSQMVGGLRCWDWWYHVFCASNLGSPQYKDGGQKVENGGHYALKTNKPILVFVRQVWASVFFVKTANFNSNISHFFCLSSEACRCWGMYSLTFRKHSSQMRDNVSAGVAGASIKDTVWFHTQQLWKCGPLMLCRDRFPFIEYAIFNGDKHPGDQANGSSNTFSPAWKQNTSTRFGSIWLCSTLPQTDVLVSSSSLLCCCALLNWLRSHQTLHLRASTAMRWQPSWPPTSSMRRCTWPRQWLPSMSYCSQEDISFSTRCKILVHYPRTGTTHCQAVGSWRSLREWVWEMVLVLGMRCDMIDMLHLHVWCICIIYCMWLYVKLISSSCKMLGGIEINLWWGL